MMERNQETHDYTKPVLCAPREVASISWTTHSAPSSEERLQGKQTVYIQHRILYTKEDKGADYLSKNPFNLLLNKIYKYMICLQQDAKF